MKKFFISLFFLTFGILYAQETWTVRECTYLNKIVTAYCFKNKADLINGYSDFLKTTPYGKYAFSKEELELQLNLAKANDNGANIAKLCSSSNSEYCIFFYFWEDDYTDRNKVNIVFFVGRYFNGKFYSQSKRYTYE